VIDPNQLPSTLILIAIFLLVAFPVHEFAHAFVAYRLGDGTAKMFGRLTLNPVVHFDPIGGLFLVITALLPGGLIFGWAKPTPVNPSMLRDRRNGEVLVALAGPASNLIMASIAAVVYRVLDTTGVDAPVLLNTRDGILFLFVVFNVALAVFNMLPIPPLDGSNLLFRFMSPQQAWQWRPVLQQYGFLILILIIFTLRGPLSSVITSVTRVLLGL
jgi:Zn-dependent protease